MNVLITGGTGFIGSALTRSLLLDGHKVWILTRNPAKFQPVGAAQLVAWDGSSTRGWLEVFSKMDAVVNLAGDPTGIWPWNAARRKGIHDSRVAAGHAISAAFEQSGRKPAVLIQASGIGYYGSVGPQMVTEADPPGEIFMARVASDWEASSSSVDSLPGVRRAIIRTSLVLDAHAGILPQMAMPVRLFAGGPLGNGRQGISWIHIEDEVHAIRFLIDNGQARGPFNLSAPNPQACADFMRALAKELRRPYWLPVPAFALKLLLGQMSTLLLDGQYALPSRLSSLGFTFKYEHIAEAFKALYQA